MKVTKRAKSVTVYDYTFTEEVCIPTYTCPSCHTGYQGAGPGKRTTRFICECGQELIVKNRIVTSEPKYG